MPSQPVRCSTCRRRLARGTPFRALSRLFARSFVQIEPVGCHRRNSNGISIATLDKVNNICDRPPTAASWEGVRPVSAPILGPRSANVGDEGAGATSDPSMRELQKPAYFVHTPIITILVSLDGHFRAAPWPTGILRGQVDTAQNICSDLSDRKKKKNENKKEK